MVAAAVIHVKPPSGRKSSGKGAVRMKPGAARRAKAMRARGRGPGRPRNSSYSRAGVLSRRGGYGRRGVRPVGRGRGVSTRKVQRRGGTGRGGSGGPVVFRTRRNGMHKGRGRGRPRSSGSRNANSSDNYNTTDEEEGEKQTTSLWRSYTCAVM